MLVNIPGETKRDLLEIENLLSDIRPTITSVNIFERYLGCELAHQEPTPETLWFARITTRRYSPISQNLKYHFSQRYIKSLFESKRKLNYLRQLWILIQETINQKFQL